MTLREIAQHVRNAIPQADNVRVVALGEKRVGIACLWLPDSAGRGKSHTHGTTIRRQRDLPAAVEQLRAYALKDGLITA